MAHIIVVGNEKGGSGKSTTSIHVATALARMGYRIAVLDLDLRQSSFGQYIKNRAAFIERECVDLPCPIYLELPEISLDQLADGENIYDRSLIASIEALHPEMDFILLDCPGSHTRLSKLAHSLADTLITPLNDSFIDFDLLAHIDPQTGAISKPSIYAEMVWEARQTRAQAGLRSLDWVVMRNRLGPQQMHNKRKVGDAVQALAERVGFRVIPGFGERVIFRELFPSGLTLLDLKDAGITGMSLSNIAARQELRDLFKALKLPGVQVTF